MKQTDNDRTKNEAEALNTPRPHDDIPGQFSMFDLHQLTAEEFIEMDTANEPEAQPLEDIPIPKNLTEDFSEKKEEEPFSAEPASEGKIEEAPEPSAPQAEISAAIEEPLTEEDEYYIPQFDAPNEETAPRKPLDANHTEEESISSRLVPYNEIKNKSVLPDFETPYLYKGKKNEYIRYRLSLPTDRNPKKERMKRNILSLGVTVIIALILAFFLRSFVFVLATVDGPSMEPTLQNNEKILVTRYSYYFQDIERGDVIVCRFDNENYPDYYVKRVIALGGETVKVQNGVVYVNDTPLEENYIKEPPRYDMEEVLVPAGYVFVMGDNRNNSTDSRKSYIGPIAQKLVVGKARCILFPFSNFGPIKE